MTDPEIEQPASKKRKTGDRSDRFVLKNKKRLGFLTSLDPDELTTVDEKTRKKNRCKPTQYPKADNQEMDYEAAPRSHAEFMDAERQKTALPVKNEEGKTVEKATSAGPRAFDGDDLTNKAKKRLAEKDMEKADKEKKKMIEKNERKKKPEKLTETQQLMKQAETFDERKLLIAKAAQRINTHPDKEMEQFDIFFEWQQEDKLGALGILSCVAVIRTMIPAYRIDEKNRHAGVKLSYKVAALHKQEQGLLTVYGKLLAALDKFRKTEPYMAYNSFAQLLLVGAQFNMREKLISNVVKGATHKDERIRKVCSAALRDVVEFDKNLESSRDIVKEMGLIMKAYAHAKSKGQGSMQGITAEMLDILQTIKLGQAERVMREDAEIQGIEDDALRAELEQGSINASVKDLKKYEVTIMTEIFVLYLRVFRCQHLQDRDRMVSMLEGLGKRASEVNLELMMELLDECRNVVSHVDVKLACMAIRCCFQLLAGPSASLMVDIQWLGDALVDTVQRYVVLLTQRKDVSGIPPIELLLETIDASLSCHQLRSGAGSQHNIARLIHGLVTLGMVADQHVGMAVIRKAQQLIVRFPKLKVLFDKEGMLFAADGTLHDTVLSLHWHQFALKHHISPVGMEAFKSFNLAISRDPKKNSLDRFAKTLSRPDEWLVEEMPDAGLVWPWKCISPPLPQVMGKPSLVPFVGPKDLE